MRAADLAAQVLDCWLVVRLVQRRQRLQAGLLVQPRGLARVLA